MEQIHDQLYLCGGIKRLQGVRKLKHEGVGARIQSLGPVQRDQAHH
jgi:hypothetical protein